LTVFHNLYYDVSTADPSLGICDKMEVYSLVAKDVSKEPCKKTKKLMDQVKRLGEKTGGNIPAKKIAQLKGKIANGSLTWSDLPGRLQTEFPGEFKGLTYNEIKDQCKGVGINFDK
jgi:anti-sigma28 factor (negative regulator of flagellin synthesis)